MRIRRGLIILLVLCVLCGGCVSPYVAWAKQVRTHLAVTVGSLTYDEALRLWGPPQRVAYGDKSFVALWEKAEDYAPFTRPTFSRQTGYRNYAGFRLEVTFDTASRTMITGQCEGW